MAVTNLFTNPRLVGDGTWAEVRRNLCRNPNFQASTSGWAAIGGESISRDAANKFSGEASLRVTTPGEVANEGVFYSPIPLSYLTSGQEVSASVRVRAPLGADMYVTLTSTGSGGGSRGVYFTGTGEWQLIETPLPATVSDALNPYILVRTSPAQAITFWIDEALIEQGSVTGPYFDGSTTSETAGDVVQPEDFRWRWLGEPNASESVMEIERVRGLTAVNAIAGVSTKGGKPAVRVIATGTNLSRVELPAPEIDELGTWIATAHLDEPLTGSLDRRRAGLDWYNPQTDGPRSLNEVGSYPLRQTVGPFSANKVVRLWHGGTQGSGDVWWTDIGLFAGEYNGPYGDGSMRGWYWAGEPDNSVSIKAPRPNPDHRRKMYFGTPGAMTWVPCPQIERPSGLTQWQEEVPLLNGGLHVRRSFGGHRVFEMTWNGISAEEAQLLEGYASGVYGDGLIYWLDPMMADKNVLPIWWSAPAMGALGAPSLGAGRRAPAVPPGAAKNRTATFELFPGEKGHLVQIPVPENHVLHVGARGGSLDGATLDIREVEEWGSTTWRRDVPLTETEDTPLQMVEEWRQPPSGRMLGLQIQSRYTGGSLFLREVVAQVLPLGVKPQQDPPHVAGMGAAGCIITEFEKTDMSAAFNKVNVTMVLKEVGPWQ